MPVGLPKNKKIKTKKEILAQRKRLEFKFSKALSGLAERIKNSNDEMRRMEDAQHVRINKIIKIHRSGNLDENTKISLWKIINTIGKINNSNKRITEKQGDEFNRIVSRLRRTGIADTQEAEFVIKEINKFKEELDSQKRRIEGVKELFKKRFGGDESSYGKL